MAYLVEDVVVAQEFEQFESDMRWIYERYEELRKAHPDHFIAVYQGKLIRVSPAIETLVAELRANWGSRVSHMAIEFIYREPPRIVL